MQFTVTSPNSTMSTINRIFHSLAVAARVDQPLSTRSSPVILSPLKPGKEKSLCAVSSNLKTHLFTSSPYPSLPYHSVSLPHAAEAQSLGACNSLTQRLSITFLTFAHEEKKAGYTFKTDYTLDP